MIVCALGRALIADDPKLKWEEWTGDYAKIRDLIEATYPDDFHDYNARLFTPGGFWRDIPAHHRIWKTESERAIFTAAEQLNSVDFVDRKGRYRLITLRSND